MLKEGFHLICMSPTTQYLLQACTSFLTNLAFNTITNPFTFITAKIIHKNTTTSSSIAKLLSHSIMHFKTHSSISSPSCQHMAYRVITRTRFPKQKIYKRHVIKTTSDGAPLFLDQLSTIPSQVNGAILVSPGIAGNTFSPCIRIWQHLATALNMHVYVYNRRGHITNVHTYVKPPTWTNHQDMHDVVTFLRQTQQYTQIIGIGYSAGSPHILDYASRYHTNAFDLIFTVSSAMDFVVMCDYLKRHPFTDNLLGSMYHHILKQFNIETPASSCLTDIDECVARHMGYNSAYEYHVHSQPTTYMKYIKTPTICIISKDDDIMCDQTSKFLTQAAQENENVVAIITTKGGHLGWVTHDMKLWVEENVIFNTIAGLRTRTTQSEKGIPSGVAVRS